MFQGFRTANITLSKAPKLIMFREQRLQESSCKKYSSFYLFGSLRHQPSEGNTSHGRPHNPPPVPLGPGSFFSADELYRQVNSCRHQNEATLERTWTLEVSVYTQWRQVDVDPRL